jgi:hypothetical protein
VYLDSLLIALAQEMHIDALSNAVQDIWTGRFSLHQALSLERRVIQFRSTAWWTDIATAPTANELLRRLQGHFRLEDQLDRLSAQISDVARYATSARGERTNKLLN